MLSLVVTLIYHLYAPIFKWKLYFQSKVLSNFWFDKNLVGKVCTCDKLLVKTLQISFFSLNVCWISNTTAARPHYSVFSFHLYSNCGFLALFYIYPAIWCLLPRLTISSHVLHQKIQLIQTTFNCFFAITFDWYKEKTIPV